MDAAGTRRWWALIGLALAVLVVGLDLTVLNLALPTLAADLNASTSDLQWFVDAYTLVLAAVLLPAGLLGDRYGRLRVLGVVGGANRRPRAARARRGRHLAAVAVGAAGAVHAGGAAEGDRGRHRRGVCQLSGGAHPRRVAAGQLLVGLGLPDQRAGGGDRRDCGGGADAGVA